MKFDYFECACSSDEHFIKFIYDEEDNLLYVSIFLKEFAFLQRVKEAIKYILGYKCRYGHFEEILINSENKDRLLKVIKQVKNENTSRICI